MALNKDMTQDEWLWDLAKTEAAARQNDPKLAKMVRGHIWGVKRMTADQFESFKSSMFRQPIKFGRS